MVLYQPIQTYTDYNKPKHGERWTPLYCTLLWWDQLRLMAIWDETHPSEWWALADNKWHWNKTWNGKNIKSIQLEATNLSNGEEPMEISLRHRLWAFLHAVHVRCSTCVPCEEENTTLVDMWDRDQYQAVTISFPQFVPRIGTPREISQMELQSRPRRRRTPRRSKISMRLSRRSSREP